MKETSVKLGGLWFEHLQNNTHYIHSPMTIRPHSGTVNIRKMTRGRRLVRGDR